jgi:hypothetical protein
MTSRSDAIELIDAQEQHRLHPETFEVPSADALDALRAGDHVKAIFGAPPGSQLGAERMWIFITAVDGDVIRGRLDSDPLFVRLRYGEELQLERRHVCDVWSAGE